MALSTKQQDIKSGELSGRRYTFMGETKIPRFTNRLLFPGEKIAFALKAYRDIAVFTNIRALVLDYRYLAGKSIEYRTYMFKHVINYSLSTPGYGLDLDSDIVLKFINQEVVHFQISKGKLLNKYLYIIYDLVSAVANGHELYDGLFPKGLSVKEINESFFE